MKNYKFLLIVFVFTVLGVFAGVMIMGILRNGLNLLGFSPFVQGVVIGAVIVFAVALDTLKKKEGENFLK